ncbi:selenide, water dikinase SelD [Salidesulfovibrio brasiliensis]
MQTVDFFTPIVNDPYRFGQIAAANALSDVYAMGGEPWSAMNIVCFPAKDMPGEILAEVLRGGMDKINESGAVLSGGHSVEDAELKYGLAVSGIVDPDGFASNRGAEPGDALILTKPIGTGVLATAVKAEWDGADDMEETLYKYAAHLNKAGGAVIAKLGLKGATDVTGFGLGGHLIELAEASGVSAELDLSAIPFIPEAVELAGMGMLPAGSICNRNYYKAKTASADGVDPILFDLVFDAQTSGGLILSAPQPLVKKAVSMLEAAGESAAVVGRVLEQKPGTPLIIS